MSKPFGVAPEERSVTSLRARVAELEGALVEIKDCTSCDRTRSKAHVALRGAPPGPASPPWVPGVTAARSAAQRENEQLRARVAELEAEIARLRDGLDAIEGGHPCDEGHREMARATLRTAGSVCTVTPCGAKNYSDQSYKLPDIVQECVLAKGHESRHEDAKGLWWNRKASEVWPPVARPADLPEPSEDMKVANRHASYTRSNQSDPLPTPSAQRASEGLSDRPLDAGYGNCTLCGLPAGPAHVGTPCTKVGPLSCPRCSEPGRVVYHAERCPIDTRTNEAETPTPFCATPKFTLQTTTDVESFRFCDLVCEDEPENACGSCAREHRWRAKLAIANAIRTDNALAADAPPGWPVPDLPEKWTWQKLNEAVVSATTWETKWKAIAVRQAAEIQGLQTQNRQLHRGIARTRGKVAPEAACTHGPRGLRPCMACSAVAQLRAQRTDSPEAELDSPPFTPPALDELAARGYERVNAPKTSTENTASDEQAASTAGVTSLADRGSVESALSLHGTLIEVGEMHGMSSLMPFPGLMIKCDEDTVRASGPLLYKRVTIAIRTETPEADHG